MKIISALFSVLLTFVAAAQQRQQDSLAILIIDRMSDVIGDLESCSFHLTTAIDVPDSIFGLRKAFADHDVYMSGPDKMLVNARGDKGHRQFMYNGEQLAYYSFDEHNYGIVPAPSTTLNAIDSFHAHYDIEFPAADFFYPSFTDDLLRDADIIRYLGLVRIDGREYFHVVASNKEGNFEFWVNNDAYNLPAKFVITYKTQKGNPQYYASFSDWKINPALPVAMFDFQPPPGSHQVRIMSKNER